MREHIETTLNLILQYIETTLNFILQHNTPIQINLVSSTIFTVVAALLGCIIKLIPKLFKKGHNNSKIQDIKKTHKNEPQENNIPENIKFIFHTICKYLSLDGNELPPWIYKAYNYHGPSLTLETIEHFELLRRNLDSFKFEPKDNYLEYKIIIENIINTLMYMLENFYPISEYSIANEEYIHNKYYKKPFPNPRYEKELKEYLIYMENYRDCMDNLAKFISWFIEFTQKNIDKNFYNKINFCVPIDGHLQSMKYTEEEKRKIIEYYLDNTSE